MVQSLAEPLELLLRALFEYYSKGEEDVVKRMTHSSVHSWPWQQQLS